MPVQSSTLWSVHSTHGIHSVGQRVQTEALQRDIRIHQYLYDWFGESHIPPKLSPAYTDLGNSLSRTRLAGEQGEVRTGSQTGFQLCRLPVRSERGRSQTHTRALADKIQSILSGPVCPVRQFVCLIGLLTATEKQVHLGRLHMRPIQWHLNNWRVSESLEKVIPLPESLHLPLKGVAGGKQCAARSTITSTKTCSAGIHRRIKRRMAHSLK